MQTSLVLGLRLPLTKTLIDLVCILRWPHPRPRLAYTGICRLSWRSSHGWEATLLRLSLPSPARTRQTGGTWIHVFVGNFRTSTIWTPMSVTRAPVPILSLYGPRLAWRDKLSSLLSFTPQAHFGFVASLGLLWSSTPATNLSACAR